MHLVLIKGFSKLKIIEAIVGKKFDIYASYYN